MTVVDISGPNGRRPAEPTLLPPHDIDMEMAVLGSMMLSATAMTECLEMLVPWPGADVFFREAHKMIFDAILALDTDGQPVDPLTVKAELERREQLGRCGTADYLHTLIAAVPAAVSAPHYARQLLVLSTRRRLRTAGTRIQQVAESTDAAPAELIDVAQCALDEAAGLAAETSASASVASLLGPFLDSLQAGPGTATGVTSGWLDLDRMISGFRPGQLVTVGGRPGMGKSVVLLNIAAHAAIYQRHPVPVLMCSLEMSRDECMERMVSAASGVSLTSIRDRILTERDWDLIAKAHEKLVDADKLVINDNQDMTIQGIRSELRAMRRAKRPAQMVIIDYIQLMENPRTRPENRQLEVSGMSRGLKKLGKEFGIPVLVGSQLNRGPEQRSDHRPVAADLRESGALEQDSDITILLYRDDAYVDESPRTGEVDLIVAKNRQGPKGTASLAFRGHYATCADLYRESPS